MPALALRHPRQSNTVVEHALPRRPQRGHTPPPRDDTSVQLVLPSGRSVPIVRDSVLVLGSDPTADVRLEDPYVSHRHASVRRSGLGQLHVEDLGSTNGTYVDGVRVDVAPLAPGMRIRIGRQRLTIEGHDARPRVRTPAERPMLGCSAAFTHVQELLCRYAPMRQAVLVHGETGTGKELAAEALHEGSPRAGGPFKAINCAAIAELLAESELFGHVRGAFTGAVRDRAGAFVEADAGTLFLDEIGELALPLQAKLLRVLELGRLTPLGGEKERRVDVRVVAATHRDLGVMVERGEFREDLYHRLRVLEIRLPPLRERAEDIPLLIAEFIDQASDEVGRRVVLTDAAIEAAVLHPWPGNIRALRNAVLQAAAMADGPIGPEELLRSVAPPPPCEARERGPTIAIPRGSYRSMRRELCRRVVAEHGSIRKAATSLGLPRSTLAAWIKPDP